MGSLLDRSVAAGLLVAVVATALTHGVVEAWSVALFEWLVATLILLWAFKFVFNGQLELRVPSIALPIATLLAVGFIQGLSLTNDQGERQSLSMDVEATRDALPVIFFLLCCLLIAANFFVNTARLRLLANFLTFYGLGMAVFAL